MKSVVKEMTIEEKASLMSGKDCWNTKGIERLNIPSIMMTDGPHGIRKMSDNDLGLNSSNKSTCFPTASMVACSYDKELITEMARAVAKEAKHYNVSIVLGPGANIKRSPLCGRNFEYFSEDPCLSGTMAGHFIKGINEENVGCSLKHFACNNQEFMRMSESNNVDMRAFMDIYIKSFKYALDISKPATVMCAYNKINEVFCAENKYLLTHILREKLGFDGAVVSDWGAVNDRVEGVRAGMDIEMPSSHGITDTQIVKAIKEGRLSLEDLDKAVCNVLNLVDKYSYIKDLNERVDFQKNQDLAQRIAENSAVLLENKDNILPLRENEKILVVGGMAKNSRYQGGGSSHITPHRVYSLLDGFDSIGVKYDYIDGYHEKHNKDNQKLIKKACDKAKNYDKVVVCVGLPESMEVEGLDRKHLNLPASHDNLVKEIAKANKNLVVVLYVGSPVEIKWKDNIKGLLLMYLAGSSGGKACANLLYGKVNPSGRLAETFPIKLEDTNSYHNYYFDKERSYYSDSIYVGYRYYDITNTPVMYPFGYGLSYTKFSYKDINVVNKKVDIDKEKLFIDIEIENVGNVDGAEVVQIYLSKNDSKYLRAKKELKAFEKVKIFSGKSEKISISLEKSAFEIFDIKLDKYVVESGEYEIIVARNSNEIIKTIKVDITSSDKCIGDDENYLSYVPKDNNFSLDKFKTIYSGEIVKTKEESKKGEFTQFNSFEEIAKHSMIGKFIIFVVKHGLPIVTKEGKDTGGYLMSFEIFRSTPLYKLSSTSQGVFSEEMVQGFLTMVNGKFFKGLKRFLKGLPKEMKGFM